MDHARDLVWTILNIREKDHISFTHTVFQHMVRIWNRFHSQIIPLFKTDEIARSLSTWYIYSLQIDSGFANDMSP